MVNEEGTTPDGAEKFKPKRTAEEQTVSKEQQSNAQNNTEKGLLDLPPEERRTERVRMLRGAQFSVDVETYPFSPVRLRGGKEEMIAFIDLIQASFPDDQLAFLMQGNINGVSADTNLVRRINEGKGMITARGGDTPTAVIHLLSTESGLYDSYFGFSNKGTGIQLDAQNKIQVTVNNEFDQIVDESIMKMHQLTGDQSFVQMLEARIRLRKEPIGTVETAIVDPANYFGRLGLDPNVLKFMSIDQFKLIVSSIKNAVAKKFHPDAASELTESEKTFHAEVMQAARILLDDEKREEYIKW